MKNLFQAIEAVDVDAVKELLKLGADADANATNEQQRSPLVAAVQISPLVAAVQKLLSLENAEQYQAVFVIIQSLLDAGANPNVTVPKQQYDVSTVSRHLLHLLISAYRLTRQKRRNSLLDFQKPKIDVSAKNAAVLKAIDLLVHYHIDLDISNSFQRTPLLEALFLGCEEIAQYFVTETKADITACDSNGNSPLHLACRGNMYDVAKKLVERGLDVNRKNVKLETPLSLLCSGNYGTANAGFILFLLRCGAEPNASSPIVDQLILFKCSLAAPDKTSDLCTRQNYIVSEITA